MIDGFIERSSKLIGYEIPYAIDTNLQAVFSINREFIMCISFD